MTKRVELPKEALEFFRKNGRIGGHKTNLHKMLTNPFYVGQFKWQGRTYDGTHSTFISVLRDVSLPAEVVRAIEKSLQREQVEMRNRADAERAHLQRELEALHRRTDAAYDDKLNGTISDEFWQRKQADWESEDARLKGHISALDKSTIDDRLLDMRRILELAQGALYLYLYAQTRGTGRTAQKSTFELLHRRCKSLSYLQKAV